MWVVYRNESDLPAFLREYAKGQRLADERNAKHLPDVKLTLPHERKNGQG